MPAGMSICCPVCGPRLEVLEAPSPQSDSMKFRIYPNRRIMCLLCVQLPCVCLCYPCCCSVDDWELHRDGRANVQKKYMCTTSSREYTGVVGNADTSLVTIGANDLPNIIRVESHIAGHPLQRLQVVNTIHEFYEHNRSEKADKVVTLAQQMIPPLGVRRINQSSTFVHHGLAALAAQNMMVSNMQGAQNGGQVQQFMVQPNAQTNMGSTTPTSNIHQSTNPLSNQTSPPYNGNQFQQTILRVSNPGNSMMPQQIYGDPQEGNQTPQQMYGLSSQNNNATGNIQYPTRATNQENLSKVMNALVRTSNQYSSPPSETTYNTTVSSAPTYDPYPTSTPSDMPVNTANNMPSYSATYDIDSTYPSYTNQPDSHSLYPTYNTQAETSNTSANQETLPNYSAAWL